LELLEEGLCDNTSTSIDGKLELADLLVDILHELDQKVDEFVLEECLSVSVGDQEAYIVVLYKYKNQYQQSSKVRLANTTEPVR
jgi:hypothetical protein